MPKRFGFCPLKMIIWRRDFRTTKTFQKFVRSAMEGQIAPIALLVATAWGSIAENSWCHRNTALLMETDDMRATKRVLVRTTSM